MLYVMHLFRFSMPSVAFTYLAFIVIAPQNISPLGFPSRRIVEVIFIHHIIQKLRRARKIKQSSDRRCRLGKSHKNRATFNHMPLAPRLQSWTGPFVGLKRKADRIPFCLPAFPDTRIIASFFNCRRNTLRI